MERLCTRICVVLLAISLCGCEAKKAWAPVGGEATTPPTTKPTTAPATKPVPAVEGDRHVTDEFAMIVPRGWRSFDMLLSAKNRLYLNGDGIGAPAIDETGSPVQMGLMVEKYPNTTDTVLRGIETLLANAERDPRLKLIGKGRIESLRLSDGTEAALLTTQFIKSGSRRSLQMKLLAKDADSTGWVVSGFLVAGRNSAIPKPDSPQAQTLRAHLMSFCFDAAKLP